MSYIVEERAGKKIFPLLGPFRDRKEADEEADNLVPQHGGSITVREVPTAKKAFSSTRGTSKKKPTKSAKAKKSTRKR
jgi:hypothetical protein